MQDNLTIATSQIAVSRDISSNLNAILSQIRAAGEQGADIVHFCETSLSGYPGIDFLEINKEDIPVLRDALKRVCEQAGKTGICVILGSHHFDKDIPRPFNSLYLINEQGEIRDRYDKRMLTASGTEWDVNHYTPGTRPVVFTVKGVRCGLLICHEWRYPELYREYYKMKTKVLFQSWYDGNQTLEQYRREGKNFGELIMGAARGYAANNNFWISASNTCRRESSFPSFLVQPDGRIFNKLSRNRAGILISRIDTGREFYDPSAHMRDKLLKKM